MTWQAKRKPEFWVPGLVRRHALARGLLLAAPLTEPSPAAAWEAFDCAGRVRAIRGQRLRVTGRLGWGAGHPGAGGAAIEWASRGGFDAAAFSAAVAVEHGATRSAQARLMTRGDIQPWAILEEVTAGQGVAVGRVSLAEGGTWQVSVPTGPAGAAQAALAVLRVCRQTRRLRLDWFDSAQGQQWAEDVWPAGGTPAASTANLALGDLPGDAGTAETAWRGLILGGWFWNRWLADCEVRRFAADPFAMFRRGHARDLLPAMAARLPGPVRRRVWGSLDAPDGPARARPAGPADVYSWA